MGERPGDRAHAHAGGGRVGKDAGCGDCTDRGGFSWQSEICDGCFQGGGGRQN